MSLHGFSPKLRRALRNQAQAYIPAVGTAGDVDDWIIFHAPYNCTIRAVRWIPQADVTGVNTNNFKLEVFDKGADGNGTTSLGSVTFASGTNVSDYDRHGIVTSNKLMAEGDVLQLKRTINGTGMTQPESMAVVEYEIRY